MLVQVLGMQKAVERALRADVSALICKARDDLLRGQVAELCRVRKLDNVQLFLRCEDVLRSLGRAAPLVFESIRTPAHERARADAQHFARARLPGSSLDSFVDQLHQR